MQGLVLSEVHWFERRCVMEGPEGVLSSTFVCQIAWQYGRSKDSERGVGDCQE